MIINNATIEYFQSVAAKVAHGMGMSKRRFPYDIEGDRILQPYEAIRAVWCNGSSVTNACKAHNVPRSSYYELEQRFVSFGVCGLFTDFADHVQYNDLEQLIILAKTARSSFSHTGLLRLAEALPLTHADAKLDIIADVLKSHGLGISKLDTDPAFFARIQRTLDELERRTESPIGGNNVSSSQCECVSFATTFLDTMFFVVYNWLEISNRESYKHELSIFTSRSKDDLRLLDWIYSSNFQGITR